MHFFDPELATKYGVEEAVLIQNFQFWIRQNYASGSNMRAGRCWTYDSLEALAEKFPYWKPHQIRRILNSLVEAGVLLREQPKKGELDRRCWYAFVDEAQFLGTKQADERRDEISTSGNVTVPKAAEQADERRAKNVTSTCQNRQIDVTKSSLRRDENDTSCKEQIETADKNLFPSERAPARKRTREKTGHPDHAETYRQFLQARGSPSAADAKAGGNNAALKWMLEHEFTAADILACHRWLQADGWYQKRCLEPSLIDVKTRIAGWIGAGRPEQSASNGKPSNGQPGNGYRREPRPRHEFTAADRERHARDEADNERALREYLQRQADRTGAAGAGVDPPSR